MPARIVAALVLALLAAPPAAATGDEATMTRLFPYDTHVETLDNGLRIIVVPMSSGGLVTYWSIVRTGSRDEFEQGRTGFAHFFEHMMFRGTERFPANVYNERTTKIGADANAYTTDDLTAYHLSFAAEDLETVMELEADRFQRLAYPKKAFETEAGAVYGEYRKNRTSPFFTIYEALRTNAYDRHTYGHTTMGYEADIKAMPGMFDYSRSFFERYYRPENVILLVVGDVDPARVFERARAHYGDWEPGYVAPDVPGEPEQKGERRFTVRYDGRSLPIAWLGYKVSRFDPGDAQRVAVDLLAELAFGSTSEIYRQLVLDEQLVEFIQADATWNRDPGLFDVITRVKQPTELDAVLERIDGAIERYRAAPPDPERLERLKSRVRYQFLMRLETPDQVASSLARVVAVTGGLEAVERYFATLASLRPEDIQAAARRFLDPQRRTVGVLQGDN